MWPKEITLRRKTIQIIVLQVLLVSILVGLILRGVLLNKIHEVEEMAVYDNMILANNAIEVEVRDLNKLIWDWAVWDDTYEFVEDMNEDYIYNNLGADTLMNLNLDVMVFIDSEYNILKSLEVNEDNEEVINAAIINEDAMKRIIDTLNPSNSEADVDQRNIILIDNKPTIVALYPILQSDYGGLHIGYLFMGRYLDDALIGNISKDYSIDLSIDRVEVDASNEVFTVQGKRIKHGTHEIRSSNTIIGHEIVNDIYGTPIIRLSVVMVRTIFRVGMESIVIVVPIVLTIIILAYIFLIWFIDKNILIRLKRLSSDVQNVTDSDYEGSTLEEDHVEDEVGHLVTDIIAMINGMRTFKTTIESKQKEILKMNETLENKVIERSKSLLGANELIRMSEYKFKTIVRLLPDVIFKLDADGQFIECEGGQPDWLLLKPEALVGRRAVEILPEHLSSLLMDMIKKTLSTMDSVTYEYQMGEGDTLQDFEAQSLYYNDNEVYIILKNITDSKSKLRMIEYLSYRDQLTGLHNRRFFEEELSRLDHIRSYPLSLLSIDVNGMKLTNDAFGHIAGDELLIAIANAIKGCCRTNDILARIGGDEFSIILAETTEEKAETLADRIKKAVADIELMKVVGSVSVGYATKSDAATNIKDTLKQADDRMYKNKIVESQQMKEATLARIMDNLAGRYSDENSHSMYVMQLSVEIGKHLGLSASNLKRLEQTAYYHDIGVVSIEQEILNKLSPLTPEEYACIKTHPDVGYQLLKSANATNAIAELVLHHHEHWNGQGYPGQLEGKAIPLISRIISVAEAYDSMIHHRIYKASMTLEEAIKELEECSGNQFDPKVVEVLLDIIKN